MTRASETPFTRFLELVAYDQATDALKLALRRYADQLKALNDAVAYEQGLLDAKKQEVHATQKKVHAYEHELRIVSGEQKRKQNRKDTVFGLKELQALDAELLVLNQKQEQLEADLEAAWQVLEDNQKKFECSEGEFSHKRTEFERVRAELECNEQQLKQDIAERIDTRRQYGAQQFPEDWLTLYESMRAKVPDPVVAVTNGHCSGCFYGVTHQDLIALGRNKLLPCKSCYRLLYVS